MWEVFKDRAGWMAHEVVATATSRAQAQQLASTHGCTMIASTAGVWALTGAGAARRWRKG